MKNQLLAACMLLSYAFGYSQEKADIAQVQKNTKGNPTFAKFSNQRQANRGFLDPQTFLQSVLKSKTDDKFILVKSETDQLKIRHSLFQRYYKNIIVDGSSYYLHGKNENIEYANGEFEDISIPNVRPTLNEIQALKEALKVVNAKKYRWQDVNFERLIKEQTKDSKATNYPKGQLVICKDRLQTNTSWKLSWKFMIAAVQPFSAEYIYIDASTGKVINRSSLICSGNATGTAATRYSGSQTFTTDSYFGGFRLRESRNGVSLATYNNGGSSTSYVNTDFTDNNNNWTTGEFNNVAMDNAALDAHWGMERVLDYWSTVHGRNSYDNSGGAINLYVHFGTGDDAGWDGTSRLAFFGDGAVDFTPLTSIDVISHEFAHGVCQTTCNLTYSGESGALNEGFSDIWGAVVESVATTGKQTWLCGEDIMANPGATSLRNMSNPNDANSLTQAPDTYGGTNWVNPSSGGDNGGVHTNSGVFNYWFYLLTVGGSGTNDNSDNFAVTGIGMTDAARIAYRTELYLTSSSNFAAARNMSIQSAIDLFGACSPQEKAVTNAWYAVGVGAAYTGSTLVITGSQTGCNEVTFTANTTDPTSYSWSFSGDYTVSSSTTAITSTNYVIATGTYGSVSLTATSGTVCSSVSGGGSYYSYQKPIVYVTAMPVIGLDQLSVYVEDNPYVTNYKWYINSNLEDQGSRIFCTCYIGSPRYCGEHNSIEVIAETNCGTFPVAFDYFDWYCYGASVPGKPEKETVSATKEKTGELDYHIFPNPATNSITVKIPSGTTAATVRLISSAGQILHTVKNVVNQTRIPVTKYATGMYVIEIAGSGKTVKKLVMITH